MAGGSRCEGFKAEINSNGSVLIEGCGDGIGNFDFTGKRDIPGISLKCDGRFFDDALDLTGLSELDPADFGEIGLGSGGADSLGIPKTVSDAAFFKLGITGLFSFFNFSKKMLKSGVEVFEGLLKDLTMDLFEPGKLVF